MLNKHVIILPRREENLIAIVRCECEGTNNDAMRKIIGACTDWVANTECGKDEWRRTCEDFNIGDLHGIIIYPDSRECKELKRFLITYGVYELHIDIIGTGDFSSDYVYDTVLVDLPD